MPPFLCMNRKLHAVYLLSSLVMFPIYQSAHAGVSTFTEVSQSSGIIAQTEDNLMSAGIAWIDYNNDDWQDIYVVNETGPNRLYKNLGTGQFMEMPASDGAQLYSEVSIGVAIGDYDGDGFDDIFVANESQNSLLKNNGNGTFTDVTGQSGLDSEVKRSFGASFGDIDRDGDLDIYVSHWNVGVSPRGEKFSPANDLYINNGDGTFSNVAEVVGVNDFGSTFQSVMTDYDSDGDLDIFTINDSLNDTTAGLEGKLYRNDGNNSDGLPSFTEVGKEAGIDQLPINSMGVAIGDYDNDGDLDYYRTQMGNGVLSTGNGKGTFSSSFIDPFPNSDADDLIGWGAAFVDVDNDGYVDLYRGNSASSFDSIPKQQNNVLYMNNREGGFVADLSSTLSTKIAGLGLAVADYDNDGDMDIVLHGADGQVDLLRNDTVSTNNWLKVKLNGNRGNHRGIGATIRLLAGSMTQMREIHAGSSHSSNHSFVKIFGLGTSVDVQRVTVTWPLGCVQVINDVSVNQELVINESECTNNP